VSDVEVKVRGDDRLAATLRRAGTDLDDLGAANDRVGSAVAQAARARAPKRTGRLARSTTGTAAPGNTVRLQATVIYAGVIHNGWARHNISPQPYLRETVEAEQDRIVSLYAGETQKIMDRVKGA